MAAHTKQCKYLGNDAWNCGHLDNAEGCDCECCMKEITDGHREELVTELSKALQCEVIDIDHGFFTNGLIAENPTVGLALFGSGDDQMDRWPLMMQVCVGFEGSVYTPNCIQMFSTIQDAVNGSKEIAAILRHVVETVTPQRQWPEHLNNEWAFTTVEHAITFLEGPNNEFLRGNGFSFLDSQSAVADLYACHKCIGIERRCADCREVIPDGQILCDCNTSGDLG